MKRFSKLAVLLLLASLVLTACGGTAEPAGGEEDGDRVLNMSILAPLTTLNPVDSNNL